MRQKIVTILVIVAVVIGGGYYAYQKILPPPPQEVTGPVYTTKPVVRGDISVGVEAVGSLNPTGGGGIQVPGNRMSMGGAGNLTYEIDEIFVKEGDEVKKGQLLVKLLAPDLDVKIENTEKKLEESKISLARLLDIPVEQIDRIDPGKGITITTPISGRITGLLVEEGKEIKLGERVAKVVDDSRFRLVAKLTQTEIPGVIIGQKVALRLPQFDGIIEGRVIDANYDPIAEPATSLLDSKGTSNKDPNEYVFVHWVTIEAENPGLVMANMRTSVGFPSGIDKDKLDAFNIKWTRYDAVVEGFVKEETIFSAESAMVTKVFVKNGQTVKAGEQIVALAGDDARKTVDAKLAEVRKNEEELRALYKSYDNLEIRASMDGVVAYIETDPSRQINPGEWLGHLYNTADMRIWTTIDDIDVLMVQQGAPVKVAVDALPGKTFEGEVTRVSTMGKDRDGITRFELEIKVAGTPELRPGMSARAFVDAGSAKGVLLAPLEAIFEDDGKSKVEVLDDNGVVRVVTVKMGLMNDRMAEIQEGLEEGEQVITGSSADVLPSQKIKGDNLLPTKPGDGDGGGGSNKE